MQDCVRLITTIVLTVVIVCCYSVVPVTSTRYAINKLKLPIKTAWRPWSTDGEVGGYVVEYDGLTFVTVRGARLLFLSYQPTRAITMISLFLGGALPPPFSIQNNSRG
ncbi:hypothetical protein F3Y22_tig00001478pilonHSYRG00437 [Hibiscus syriacus]|uniref:Uncharacterized protein n=1 Tax=Hibiscus syriacus TaxID=106335 RepID=A0A6A3CXT7_HIBSY|nr:hypothetical protein F3Y22_tig00001478pilonHSYRG00437 [Hibiscus syriacus]